MDGGFCPFYHFIPFCELLFNPHPRIYFTDFRERVRGGETERKGGGGEGDVRQKHQSVASYTCPHQVANLQYRFVLQPEWNGQPYDLQDDAPTN